MVTGGWVNDAIATVQVYTLSGPQYPQLPDLRTPRYNHACAHYLDSQDRAVSIACNITAHLTIVTLHRVVMINNDNVQVLLVTGGYSGGYLDSTELLLPSATSWTSSGALLSARKHLRGATLNNKVVVTGTNIDTLIHMFICMSRFILIIFKFITQFRGMQFLLH